ncbi:MAG: CoA transferase, partial [Actinobacteria bacterium]|nr:CoA transferase [Actinomycetota bacterium]
MPLDDLFVVDLSSGIPGAYCTKVLADAGADVVKVESPAGDPLRRWSAGAAIDPDDDGALFQFLSGGKRSMVLDVANASDLALTYDLV